MEINTNSLKSRWQALLEEEPKIRIRNAAQRLQVSEVELLSTTVGETAVRLEPDFRAILSDVKSLGKVMALTRNEHVVHERKGVYENESLAGSHFGLFVNEDIDLRIFWAHWSSVFAVRQMSRGKERKSLQFFDPAGQAVHKIYLTPASDGIAYDGLVEKYRSEDQSAFQSVELPPLPPVENPDDKIDVVGFQNAWRGLQDTHDFFGVLKKYGVGRLQAMRLAPEGNYVVSVPRSAFRKLFVDVAASGIPIMVFVGNRGMIQIHTGPVKRLVDYENWFNVMDPDFNLHLNEDAIGKCFVVRKPTADGVVTSLEVFDAYGEMIVQVFGKRKPGIPELDRWRETIERIEQIQAAMQ